MNRAQLKENGFSAMGPIISEIGRNRVAVETGHGAFERIGIPVSLERRGCLNIHGYEDVHVMDRQQVRNKRDGIGDGELNNQSDSRLTSRTFPDPFNQFPQSDSWLLQYKVSSFVHRL